MTLNGNYYQIKSIFKLAKIAGISKKFCGGGVPKNWTTETESVPQRYINGVKDTMYGSQGS